MYLNPRSAVPQNELVGTIATTGYVLSPEKGGYISVGADDKTPWVDKRKWDLPLFVSYPSRDGAKRHQPD
jgi:hypothetical protein